MLGVLPKGVIMQIEKWYLDVVSPEGSGVIGYFARVRLGPLTLRCAESLQWRAGDPAAQSRIAFGGNPPTAVCDGVRWNSPAVGVEGRWRSRVPAIPTMVLHREPAGRVEWTCFCPAAEATVKIGRDRWEGSGYAERLVMTLPPARLPIRELRWGRFISGEEHCIWIRWRGPIGRRWCVSNGRPVEAAMPDSHELAWSGHRLQLEPGAILRNGCIADTALKGAGFLGWLLPASVRKLHETKWCSRGMLTDGHGREHRGWAIHEVAVFP
jgi:hypothetical protein